MKKQRALPFQNVTSEGWQNLALVAVLAFYVIQIGFDVISHNMCGNLAIDYCAYWSGGVVINKNSFADVYDIDLITQFQRTIYPTGSNPSLPFQVVPIPYLPVFVIPFPILSLMGLEISFWIWTLLNGIGFVLYLRFFAREVTGQPLPVKLTVLFMFSLPVFLNLFWGQVNIWLGICVGEFMRAALSDKPFRAGLWLGGLLLKPQTLVLIIPFYLMQRSIKTLIGFTTSTMALLAISFGLVGIKGLNSLLNLLLGSAQGGSASNPEIMMNWRMFGLHIGSFTSPLAGWTLAIAGSILTIIATLLIARKPIQTNSTKSAIALIGIFAATGAVTWHAHLSMSIILIPAMLYLVIQKTFPAKLLSLWVFMPTGVMMIIYILAALMQANILPIGIAELLNFLAGLRGLILNLIILTWAVFAYLGNTFPKYDHNTSDFAA